MTMHAPRLLVRSNNPPIRNPHTIAVSHQFPCTRQKASATTKNAVQFFSPTWANLKSAGAMIERQRKSRQNNSSMTGTTSVALATRTPIQVHMIAGEENAFIGSKATDGLKG